MSIWNAVCTSLERLGVERVFGVPGTQTVELFEELRRSRISVTLPTHELAAAFMAGGYYRATGRVGVLLTIGGPGFAYAVPGLAEARLDSVGLLHIVTAPATDPGKHFHLQAIDQSTIAGPLSKAEFRVGPDDDALSVLTAAYHLAEAGEPGPVLVQVSATGSVRRDPAVHREISQHDVEAGLVRLDALYAQSERPLFMLGQGALSAAAGLGRIVDARSIPVITTPAGRGVISEDHPLVTGFDVLRGGLSAANDFIRRSDLVIVLGAKLGHNGSAGFGLRLPADRLVHVDREPNVLGANYETSLSIVADGTQVVERLEKSPARDRVTAWDKDEVAAFRARIRAPSDSPEPVVRGNRNLNPSSFFSWLRDSLPDDAILVTDSGLHQILTRRHFDIRAPRGLMIPSDFQSMGFGLPSAIGAKLGAPDRPVVALIGDGGFLITAMELLTAVRDEIPMLLIVFNDGQLNQIRLQQLENHGRSHAVQLGEVDYEAFARSVGARYARFGEVDADGIQSVITAHPPMLLEVSVGDSWGVRAMATERRAKSVVRDALGPGVMGWVKARLKPR
ncbi:MAG: thiamine pyrophosphate-binding protein [Dehalococcoidia bacterium]